MNGNAFIIIKLSYSVKNKLGIIIAVSAIMIIFAIEIILFGNSIQDCSEISGYDFDNPKNSTGWAETCFDNLPASQSGYYTMIGVMVVIAVTLIILIIRLLG